MYSKTNVMMQMKNYFIDIQLASKISDTVIDLLECFLDNNSSMLFCIYGDSYTLSEILERDIDLTLHFSNLPFPEFSTLTGYVDCFLVSTKEEIVSITKYESSLYKFT
ncbi:MAG: hypothetical protein K0R28_5142 [Paenibacillus sp.]|nr:hypothetical protein [Paenibacillus sp.]